MKLSLVCAAAVTGAFLAGCGAQTSCPRTPGVGLTATTTTVTSAASRSSASRPTHDGRELAVSDAEIDDDYGF